jgi:putative ABC transport system ATP-binding protein
MSDPGPDPTAVPSPAPTPDRDEPNGAPPMADASPHPPSAGAEPTPTSDDEPTGELPWTTGNADGHLYELRNVERRYVQGSVPVLALHDVDLVIERGETLSIEGPSGSGKSTLLQLLGALDVVTAGVVRFDGNELGEASDKTLTRIRGEEIGFVFQQFNLIPTLTAAENVSIPMFPHRASKTARRERAAELLELVGLGSRLDHLPSALSGGEQQRVAIARALVNKPRVIVADEPTGNLDSQSAEVVMNQLMDLQTIDEGVTIIVATHDDEVARRLRRQVRLRDGVIVTDTAA